MTTPEDFHDIEKLDGIKPPKEALPRKMKTCDRCGNEWPLDEVCWHKDPNSDDGYRNTCKKCRNEDEKREREREKKTIIQQRIEEFDNNMLAMIESLPRVKDSDALPHITTYFENLNRLLGGPDGIARHTMMTYLAASPAVRARILMKVYEMNEKISDDGYALPPVEMLTTEDLERELNKRIKNIQPLIAGPTRDSCQVDRNEGEVEGAGETAGEGEQEVSDA